MVDRMTDARRRGAESVGVDVMRKEVALLTLDLQVSAAHSPIY